jgi:hypothetical protein
MWVVTPTDGGESLERTHRETGARDAKASREIARACGVALINLTAALEEGLRVQGPGAVDLALTAFAARGRRLLRSAYRLIDAGERDSAVPLFRILNEYLIVSRWLLSASDEEQHLWAWNDLRSRLNTLREVLRDPSATDEEGEALLTAEIAATEEQLRRYRWDQDEINPESCPTCGRPSKKQRRSPTIEAMAKRAGLGFVYSYAYRTASQNDVHATAMAIDNSFDEVAEALQVRPVPRFALEYYESYRVGAHLFLDLIRPLAERATDLGWEVTVTRVTASLEALDQGG